MYDGCPSMDSPLWNEYKDFLIINFSKTMHLNCLSLGLISRYIQYFPEPVDVKNWGKEDSVFFWNRIEHININTVAELLASSHISHLHLHKALDPGHTFIKLNKKWNSSGYDDNYKYNNRIYSFYYSRGYSGGGILQGSGYVC